MRSASRAGLVTAVSLLLLTALAGCGDGADAGQRLRSPGRAERSATPSDTMVRVRDCRVSLTLSGAMTRTLRGTGRAIYDNGSGPRAFYQFTSGDLSVQVYSEGPSFAASVVISTKSGSYTSEPGAEGLRVRTSGRSAEVDADMVALDESSQGVHLKATYLCA